MPLDNLALLAIYLSEKPGRLPNLIRNRAISRTFISKNDSLKLAYLVNPKVASSSISIFLAGGIDVSSLQGISTRQTHTLLRKEALHSYSDIDRLREAGYFVFSFVRNPFSRIVSFYKNKFEPISNGLLRPKKFAIKRQFRDVKNFGDVARVICDTPDYLSDAHFMSQSRILFGPDGRNRLDFIGKLENMEKDFSIISQRINRGALAKMNSTSGNCDWMNFYTADIANMVRQRFESDFTLFDFEDEFHNLMDYLQRV